MKKFIVTALAAVICFSGTELLAQDDAPAAGGGTVKAHKHPRKRRVRKHMKRRAHGKPKAAASDSAGDAGK